MTKTFWDENSPRVGGVTLDFIKEVYNNLSATTKQNLNGYHNSHKIPAKAFKTILYACGWNMSKKYHTTKKIIRDASNPMLAKNTLVFTGVLRRDISDYMLALYNKHDILKPELMEDLDVVVQEISGRAYDHSASKVVDGRGLL